MLRGNLSGVAFRRTVYRDPPTCLGQVLQHEVLPLYQPHHHQAEHVHRQQDVIHIQPRQQVQEARAAHLGHGGAVLHRRGSAPDALLGEEGAGFGQLPLDRLSIAWRGTVAALRSTVDHTRNRQAFDNRSPTSRTPSSRWWS